MKLIAKRPCCFGGRKFYIGDEVPAEMVLDPASQEKLGVLSVLKDREGEGPAGTFTREQVDGMVAEAVTGLAMTDAFAGGEITPAEPCVDIMIREDPAGAVHAAPEEIRQVFAIMQANADEGVRMIAEVTDENILILLHVADSRKTIKNAARERAERLFPAREEEPAPDTEAREAADASTSEGGSAT